MSPHESTQLPWKELLIPQIFNFTIFVALLVYFLRKPLAAHFSGKNEEFEELKKKAEEYKVQAERQNVEVRAQLKALEETSSAAVENAKKESEALKEKMIVMAQEIAKKMTEESHKMAEFELQRAISALRLELLQNSTQMAEQNLTRSVSESTQNTLNEAFIKNVQAGR